MSKAGIVEERRFLRGSVGVSPQFNLLTLKPLYVRSVKALPPFAGNGTDAPQVSFSARDVWSVLKLTCSMWFHDRLSGSKIRDRPLYLICYHSVLVGV